MRPTISVLLPAFNSEQHLEEAMNSILSQTYNDLELIVIDDGSSDRTREIATKVQKQDSRVRVVAHDENRGLAARLNEGLSTAQGEYIARMDADDISVPRRFQLQIDYLAAHPHVAVVGGFIELFNEKRRCVVPVATSPSLIRWRLLFGNSMGHVTVLGRRSFFIATGGYNETLKVAQDYDLWLKGSKQFQLGNIPDVLVRVREDPGSTSRRLSVDRQYNAIDSLNRAHRDLVGTSIPREVSALCFSPSLLRGEPSLSSHVVLAMEVVERMAVIFLSDPSVPVNEARVVRKEARYKLAQLILLEKRPNWFSIVTNRQSALLRRRDLVAAVVKHVWRRAKLLLTGC